MRRERSSRFEKRASRGRERARESDLARWFASLPAAWLLFGSDGNLRDAGGQLERLCGGSADDLLAGRANPFLHDPRSSACPVSRAFLTGCTEQQVGMLQSGDGQEVYIHRTVSPLRDDGTTTTVERVLELRVDVSPQVDRGDLRVLALWRVEAGGSLVGPGAL